jgi:uncharacterized protein YjdB
MKYKIALRHDQEGYSDDARAPGYIGFFVLCPEGNAMLPLTRSALVLTIALLSSACSEVTAPAVDRVTLDRHAATLWYGDVLATSVSVFRADGEVVANPRVTYISSDSLVASVDSTGKVYAHVAGRATITAALGSVKDTLNVTVLWAPLRTLVFRDNSLELYVGDTFTSWVWAYDIKGNVAIHTPLTYSSSAPGIATVDEPWWGMPRIVAVAEGQAAITVRAEGFSDVLPVTVTRR